MGTNTGSSYVYRNLGDCNGNGTLDLCDLVLGLGEDLDGDGILDECQAEPCPTDIDGSGLIDFGDLLAVLSAWGPCTDCPADLDGNGAVGFEDLLTVLSEWGACP
jgi:Ca2+-binding EF-hand superfamily protein